MGGSNENSAFHPTHNPWDLARIPGGSSGGAAAAWPPAWPRLSIGTDTGGSIRCPAGLCGVTGLKPTYGRVSRYGLVAFASSLDQIGPLARTAEDAALLLEVLAGHDPLDSTSVDRPVPRLHARPSASRWQACGWAWCASISARGSTREVEAAVREAVRVYESLGAKVKRRFAAAQQVRGGHLLHHRPLRGLQQPGPLRRRPLRLSHRRKADAGRVGRPSGRAWKRPATSAALAQLDNPLVRHVSPQPGRRFRAGGEAPHHARHLRPERRLLRRLLQEGPQGPPADPPGFRPGASRRSI